MNMRAKHARVTLPELGCIPALVEIDGARATVMLLARPIRPLDAILGEGVAIHLTTARGLLRLEGRISTVAGRDRLELEVHGRSELIQRRAFARVDAFVDVLAVAPPGSAKTTAAAIVNISAAGAVVSRLEHLSLGDPVDLMLTLAPQEPPVEIGARVVREFDRVLRAVYFERLHDADRERIVRFVIARQRLELKRAGSA
jgi:hypothetical protein